MRKLLAMVLGVALVVSAVPAFAASQVDFSGYYRAYYFSQSNMQRGDEVTDLDNYFISRLNLDIQFVPTDEIKVIWRLRGPANQRWGAEGFNNGDGSQGGLGLHTRFLYGEITQDWGTVRVGKMNRPHAKGLGDMGYAPSFNDGFYGTMYPFDPGLDSNGIVFVNTWDNGFGLKAGYLKMTTQAIDNPVYVNDKDFDVDQIYIEPSYAWEGGGAGLAIVYQRDASDSNRQNWQADRWVNGVWTEGDWVDNDDNGVTTAWFLNPAIMQTWGAFSVHAEAKFGWGEKKFDSLLDRDPSKVKAEGTAFYLDGRYDYGPGNVTLAGWWVSGNKLGEQNKDHALVSSGTDFYPLVVAFESYATGWNRYNQGGVTNAVTLANTPAQFAPMVDDQPGAFERPNGAIIPGIIQYGLSNRNDDLKSGLTNYWTIGVFGNHTFTDEISMHYALAYMGLNHANFRVLEPNATYTYQDKDLGWEIDLGFSFKLLDNLTFNTAFGYMFNGDAYKDLVDYDPANGGSKWSSPDNTYSWVNTLTFAF